ncbi:MAG: HAD family phosphatase [Clostridia bacterium]|nr:HAD family phosphatase [Clostridia bacterium]
MKKAIIFDFNGTMIFDTLLNERAWHSTLEPQIGRPLTREDFDRNIIGLTNSAIFRSYLGDDLTAKEIQDLTEEKEAEYRRQCLLDRSLFRLIDGLPEFLDYLRERGYAMTIATGSPFCNLDFFFAELGLDRWFNVSDIIYDDGTFPGKPDPTIYLRTMKALGVSPEDCVVFEDSLAGVQSAHRAGVNCVLALNATEDEAFYDRVGGVTRLLRDYRDYLTFPI